MKRRIVIWCPSVEVRRRIRQFGDFVTVPLASLIFIDLAGVDRLYLVLAGLAAWTLLEYLVHRFVFHRCSSVGRRLHQLHHDHPNDPDAERSSLSTPLIAFPIGFLLIATGGVKDGSAIFAGLLLGYEAFITVHYAVHRWPIGPNSLLYPAKRRHLTHHRFESCNFGVTTSFWDIILRTYAGDHRRTSPFRGWMKGFDFGPHSVRGVKKPKSDRLRGMSSPARKADVAGPHFRLVPERQRP
jgi:sterol desaturase/sphingolipid hydroxylase (fatty acid hydroxylase superfamily)